MTEETVSEDARPAWPANGGGAVTASALEPSFPAWGLTWRSIVSAVGLASVIAAPWAGVWFYRWFAGRIALPGGRSLQFDADVRGAWPLFVATGLSDWLDDALGEALDTKLVLAISALAGAALWAWLVRWFIPRLRTDGGAARLGFTGSFLGLMAWAALLYIGVFSVIGWAWALKNMLKWVARRISGTLAVEFHATGFEILWRTLLLIVLCLPIVPIPWALKQWTNWIVSQFSVRPLADARATAWRTAEARP